MAEDRRQMIYNIPLDARAILLIVSFLFVEPVVSLVVLFFFS
jgi:hypothetical protein